VRRKIRKDADAWQMSAGWWKHFNKKGEKNEKHGNVRRICFSAAYDLDVGDIILADAVCGNPYGKFLAQKRFCAEFSGQGLSLS